MFAESKYVLEAKLNRDPVSGTVVFRCDWVVSDASAVVTEGIAAQ